MRLQEFKPEHILGRQECSHMVWQHKVSKENILRTPSVMGHIHLEEIRTNL
jgi:hypothetical protein